MKKTDWSVKFLISAVALSLAAGPASAWFTQDGGAGTRTTGTTPPVKGAVVAKVEDTNPVNPLSRAFFDASKPDLQKAVIDEFARRFHQVIMSGAKGESYVMVETRKDGKLDAAVAAVVRAWVEAEAKTPEKDRKFHAVHLYFVLGAGEKEPAWAAQAGLGGKLGGFKTQDLIAKMSSWTDDEATAAKKNPKDQFYGRQLGGTKQVEWVRAFLVNAGEAADKIMLDKSIDDEKLREEIKRKAEPVVPPVVVDEDKDDEQPDEASGRKATMKEMFMEGGINVKNMHQEGDKISRDIYFKLRQERSGDAISDGISVCDFTNGVDPFCSTYRVNASGSEVKEPLDKRTGGKMEYTLYQETAGDDIVIVYGRPKDVEAYKEAKGDPKKLTEFMAKRGDYMVVTSRNELRYMLAAQAVKQNRRITINDQQYFQLAQGGVGDIADSGVLLYPVEIKKQLRKERTTTLSKNLRPRSEVQADLVAVTPRKDKGAEVDKKKGPDLGKAGKPGAKKRYHLEWDEDREAWVFAEGEGYKPKGPAKETGGGGGGKDTEKKNPEEKEKDKDKPVADFPGAVKDILTSMGLADKYDPNEELNKAAPANKAYFLKINKNGEEWVNGEGKHKDAAKDAATAEKRKSIAHMYQNLMVVPGHPNEKKAFFVPFYWGASNREVKGVKIVDKRYLRAESGAGVAYADMERYDPGENLGFERVATVRKDEQSIDVEDKALLGMAMDDAGFEKTEVKTAELKLAELLKGDELVDIKGNKKSGSVVAKLKKGGTKAILGKDGVTNPDRHGKHGKTAAAGTAYDGLVSGPVEPFLPELELGETGKAETVVIHDNMLKPGAALYVTKKDNSIADKDKKRKWYLIFNLKNDKDMVRTNFIEVLGEGVEGLTEFPAGVNPGVRINSDGLTKHDFAGDLRKSGFSLRLITVDNKDKKTPKKAVYAGFAIKEGQNKEEHCLGPVLWWGVSDEAAARSCKKNKLVE